MVLKREELNRLWMALGLVQADERRIKEAEDVGNDVFQILVSSSLFQDVKMDEDGYVVACGMHDLVHDLAVSLSKHESICMVDPKVDDIARIPQVKHLEKYVYRKNISLKNMISIVFKDVMRAITLHTLIFEGEVEKNISFQSFKCMRILKLRGCKPKKMDDSIGELVHLRYLDLSKTDIDVLPKSLGKLYHLQTLALLRCYSLKMFPQEMSNLISLRHLVYGKLIPIPNVGRLTSLRTLPYFRVGQEKRCQISELGPLKHLAGKLTIINLENSSKEDAAKADLFGKKNLYQIELCWSSDEGANRNDNDVLEGLQPPANVKYC